MSRGCARPTRGPEGSGTYAHRFLRVVSVVVKMGGEDRKDDARLLVTQIRHVARAQVLRSAPRAGVACRLFWRRAQPEGARLEQREPGAPVGETVAVARLSVGAAGAGGRPRVRIARADRDAPLGPKISLNLARLYLGWLLQGNNVGLQTENGGRDETSAERPVVDGAAVVRVIDAHVVRRNTQDCWLWRWKKSWWRTSRWLLDRNVDKIIVAFRCRRDREPCPSAHRRRAPRVKVLGLHSSRHRPPAFLERSSRPESKTELL